VELADSAIDRSSRLCRWFSRPMDQRGEPQGEILAPLLRSGHLLARLAIVSGFGTLICYEVLIFLFCPFVSVVGLVVVERLWGNVDETQYFPRKA
jgi:hypothetical protein